MKIEYRAVIKYFHKDMVQTLGKKYSSYATVKRRVIEFKRGRDSVNSDNAGEEGSPSRQVAMRTDISQEQVNNILTNGFGMSKVSTPWGARLLTPDQK